jgi:MYXO-CTERM domain-containing protein
MAGFWAWLNTVPDGWIWAALAAMALAALWAICRVLERL